jgi:integrase
MAWLLDRYSSAYASNQYRALQQFFRRLAAEDEMPDPMAGLQPPRVTDKLVPVFTGGELSRLEQACAGRSFAQRRAPGPSAKRRLPALLDVVVRDRIELSTLRFSGQPR